MYMSCQATIFEVKRQTILGQKWREENWRNSCYEANVLDLRGTFIYWFVHPFINSECKLKGEAKFLILIAFGSNIKGKGQSYNSDKNEERRGGGREREWERERKI